MYKHFFKRLFDFIEHFNKSLNIINSWAFVDFNDKRFDKTLNFFAVNNYNILNNSIEDKKNIDSEATSKEMPTKDISESKENI